MPHHLFSRFDAEAKTILGQCCLPFRRSLSHRSFQILLQYSTVMLADQFSILGGILIEASKESINSRGKYFFCIDDVNL